MTKDCSHPVKHDCGNHDCSNYDCGNHDSEEECDQRRVYWQLCTCIVGIILLILFVILIVWLVLRPMKPRFYLKATAVSQLNVTSDFNCLTTVMQVCTFQLFLFQLLNFITCYINTVSKNSSMVLDL
jgi:hypothetical protein